LNKIKVHIDISTKPPPNTAVSVPYPASRVYNIICYKTQVRGTELKILAARMVTRSKFRTREDQQMLVVTVQNLVTESLCSYKQTVRQIDIQGNKVFGSYRLMY
jgi:hypothetical protein